MNDLSSTLDFSHLESKGFLVIPSFLPTEDIQFMLEDFNSQGESKNSNYKVVDVKPTAMEKISDKMAVVVDKVQQQTDINVDCSAIHLGYYFASESINFGWHQDHESFYVLQNHYDYLNFFIPIQKPVKEKGNLKLVPWDVLKKRFPEAYNKLVRSGGNSTHVINGKTVFTADQGLTAEVPIDIDEICATPELNAGDLLLFRGDMVHKTQDSETDRIALSVRLTNPNTPISSRELLTAGKRKSTMMINNWHDFGAIFKAFQASGQQSMTWEQLQEETKKIGKLRGGFFTKGKVIHVRLWLKRLLSGTFFSSIKRWRGSNHADRYIDQLQRENRT